MLIWCMRPPLLQTFVCIAGASIIAHIYPPLLQALARRGYAGCLERVFSEVAGRGYAGSSI